MGLFPWEVAYVAYTGRAAQVLRSKGCTTAITAHKLLYQSKFSDKTGKFYNYPRKTLEKPYKLIVVDEVSMLPLDMWNLLLSHKIPVIALGDPGQLLPVSGTANGVLAHPHVFLDEVMRQAKDNEILRLSLDIREGKPLEYFMGKDVRIVPQKELNAGGIWKWPDQILVGKNLTRSTINDLMRKNLFHRKSSFPEEGDKIICLHNDWEVLNDNEDALVNGLTGTIHNIRAQVPSNEVVAETFCADFLPDYEGATMFTGLEMDTCIFTEHEAGKNKYNAKLPVGLEYMPHYFDYGYCITTHKSQGSEYDRVLVLEEFLRGQSKADHIRWLYTAATRAAKKLIIVKDYRL